MIYVHTWMIMYPSIFGLGVQEYSLLYISLFLTYIHCIFVKYIDYWLNTGIYYPKTLVVPKSFSTRAVKWSICSRMRSITDVLYIKKGPLYGFLIFLRSPLTPTFLLTSILVWHLYSMGHLYSHISVNGHKQVFPSYHYWHLHIGMGFPCKSIFI